MYNPALRLLVMKSGLKSMSVKKDCPD